LPEHVQELIERMKESTPTTPFPPNLKTFARTLHFHSPAAYNMIRNSFLKCLPSVKTLNEWLRTSDCKPGISYDIISQISDLAKNKEGQKLFFNLTFDEVGIKKHKEWDKVTKSWKGLVDLSGQLSEKHSTGEHETASKSLVFMLVNVNGGFKVPVAFYLISSLTGEEKSILLRDLLIALAEKSINVVGVTFDGDPGHKTACQNLGANLNWNDRENFKPYFKHPLTNEPVYIFYDACHCLKLCRNYLALKGPLLIGKNFIDWNFIKKLNEKQKKEKLHCANKLTNKHVFFQNEKMKVYLAAQTLSRSVCISLKFIENEIRDPDFTDSNSTAEFCRMFDDIFDLLNNRSKFQKNQNKQLLITRESLSLIKNKIDTYIDYIESLCIYDKTSQSYISVLKSRSVMTGFTGFIISLTNIYNVAKNLIENHYLDYLLSYKFSQDHIEMFFSLIRLKGGNCNNPTTTQFLSSYKKLIANKMTCTISTSANCRPLDNTLLLSSDDKSYKKERVLSSKSSNAVCLAKVSSNIDIRNNLHKNADIYWEHDYGRISNWSLNEYRSEIIAYVAGSIVHVVRNKIHCEHCLKLLVDYSFENKTKLISLRNYGGLNYASQDVQTICKCTETVIRQTVDIFVSNIYEKISCETLQILPKSIFNDNHFLEQELMMDHRSQLILLIISKYIDIRIKHEAKLLNTEQQRVRMKNNKMTIFSGQ